MKLKEGPADLLQSKFGQYQLRGWADFLDTQRFALPETNVALDRAITNFNYYALNYAIIGSFIGFFMM